MFVEKRPRKWQVGRKYKGYNAADLAVAGWRNLHSLSNILDYNSVESNQTASCSKVRSSVVSKSLWRFGFGRKKCDVSDLKLIFFLNLVSMFQFLAGICLKKTIFVKEKYFWEIESFKFFGIFWFDLDQAHIKINKKFIFYQQSVFSIIIALFCALSYKHQNKKFCWEYILVIYQKSAWIPHLTWITI